MAFEETTGDPLVNDDTDHQDQELYASIDIFLFFSLFNGIEEELGEGLKRVLVHVIDNPELNEQEIKHGTFGSDWTIRFSGLVNLSFSDLSLNLLILNDSRSLLGNFELLDETDILKDSFRVSTDELMEQVGLELGELDNEILLFLGEVFFLSFKFGLLNTHNHSKELVLKTRLCNNEIHNCALSGRLWLVMRIDQLGLQVKLE
jgi:hypothetical protein